MYRKNYIRTLIFILKVNRYYRDIFLMFLLANFPANVMVVIKLLGEFNIITFLVLLIFFSEQAGAIILLHLAIATFNAQHNNTCKQMISQFVPYHNRVPSRYNFKLNMFIQAYYTKKKYGITYGRFGLISLLTFTKVNFSTNS